MDVNTVPGQTDQPPKEVTMEPFAPSLWPKGQDQTLDMSRGENLLEDPKPASTKIWTSKDGTLDAGRTSNDINGGGDMFSGTR